MPTYDYKCKSCRHAFELRKAFHEDPSASCPLCGEEAQRMFVPVPIVFKGSGFYVTDHRDAGKSSAVDSAKPATPKPVVPETKSSGESAKDKAPVSQKETAGSAKA